MKGDKSYVKRKGCHLMVGLIKRYCYVKMSYFPPYHHSKNKIKVELDLSNFATKSAGVGTSQFAKKDDLANLKTLINKILIN